MQSNLDCYIVKSHPAELVNNREFLTHERDIRQRFPIRAEYRILPSTQLRNHVFPE